VTRTSSRPTGLSSKRCVSVLPIAVLFAVGCRYGVEDPFADSGLSGADGGSVGDATSTSGPPGLESETDGVMGIPCEQSISPALSQPPISVMLLIDRSGSMTEQLELGNPESGTRSEAVKTTLFDETDGVVAEFEEQVKFGMTLYSGDDDELDECPELTEVSPDFNNRETLEDAYRDPLVGGTTPTGPAMERVAADFAAIDDGTTKAIILATDGEPNTCNGDSEGSAEGRDQSIDAVEGAFDLGVRTFVLSVGNSISSSHLQALANAGAGEPSDDERRARYYTARDGESLEETFATIISTFRSCQFEFDLGGSDLDLANICQGSVSLGNDELVCGVDWVIDEQLNLSLLGEACDRVQAGENPSVAFPCDIVVS